ncbi:TPA: aspartate kinase [bacterium]|nr:aspartate kinase [bacterium]
MMDVIVSKYGGSSITCTNDFERIKKITSDDSKRKVIVVSAPGRRSKDDIKVTDMLIELAKTKDQSLVNKIIGRYKEIMPDKSLDDISKLLNERIERELDEDEYLASLKAFGEEACARLLAQYLDAEYIDPIELFLVSDEFDNAKIQPVSESMIATRMANISWTCVVPGFYGYTKDGLIATFGRNASDVTGAYIAASIDAAMYEVFTDTDGVLAASPAIVDNPHKVPELTFREMRDLAYSGFTIMHPEAMEPVARKGVSIHIRNTFSYPNDGTYILQDRISDTDKPIVGVAYQDGFCSFNIERFGLNEEVGIVRRILQVFEDDKISVEFIPSAIDDVSIVLKESQLKRDSVGKIERKIRMITGYDANIEFQERLGSLVVAGKGLKGYRGISAEIQLTLANAGVNIKFITQGSQERCIVYGIDSSDGTKAVKAVYEKYLR